MRIDQWLHATRFFKTRSLASDAIKRGQVRLNGQRCKPASLLGVGDTLSVKKAPFTWTVTATQVLEKRISASLAEQCYQEHSESIAARETTADNLRQARLSMIKSEGKPSKRDRRHLDRLRQSSRDE
ncbi:RNA-binding S4 domain-containing protein [Gammaproteobacteria bacterium]|nr:RNA-binding S4 domain-containing protein [Gammaproteobacteria bacterium]